MKAIYNSRIIDQEDIQISTYNRAFCYGDGLFETIVTGPDRINLVKRHINRLKAHCQLLRLALPSDLTENLNHWIDELASANGLLGYVRTKVIVWRKEGGLYAPDSDQAEFIITQKEANGSIVQEKELLGISKESFNHYTAFSHIKSLSALTYIIAGIEMKEKNWDEIVLLDDKGNLSETHLGNLFWVKGNQVYTPSLKTGCIEGVMRSFILDFYKKEGEPVQEVIETAESLNEAEVIFSSNASGITSFNTLYPQKGKLESLQPYLAKLIKRLQQP